jgi:hypothetical protein
MSLSDFVQTEGRISNATYSPGLKVDSFDVGSRRCDLISLRRLMQAGKRIGFVVERTVQNAFPRAESRHRTCLRPDRCVAVTVTVDGLTTTARPADHFTY